MKRLKPLLALLFGFVPVAAVAQPAEGAGEARIEGQVVSATTKQPLRGATVKLQRAVFTGAPTEPAYTCSTDDAGRFVLQGVRADRYWLVGERPGYLRQGLGGSPGYTTGTVLSLEGAQTIKDLTLALSPQSTISGKVVDASGEPVGGGRVTALILPFGGGARMLQPVSSAEINVAGGFVVGGLAPGKYYLRVDGHRGVTYASTTAAGAADRPEEANIPTYYPRAVELSAAAPVDVPAGGEVGGIEIAMQKSRVFSVRGKVSFAGSAAPKLINLVPKSFDLLAVAGHKISQLNKDGAFQFNQVPPGDYVVEPDPGLGRVAGRVDVTVTNGNLENLVLAVGDPPAITGKIRVEDSRDDAQALSATAAGGSAATQTPARAAAPSRSAPEAQSTAPPPPPIAMPGANAGSAVAPTSPSPVGARVGAAAESSNPRPQPGGSQAQAENLGIAGPAPAGTPVAGMLITLNVPSRIPLRTPLTTVASDGSFHLDAGLDTYRVDLSPLPPGTYVKSVAFNRQELPDRILDTTAGSGGSIEVVLSANAGEIGGTLRDSNGAPLSKVSITAWNSDLRNLPGTAVTDGAGNFTIGNLAPGKYSVVAWEEIHPNLAKYRKFCAIFQSQAETVEVAERGHVTVSPKVIPRPSIEAAAVRID